MSNQDVPYQLMAWIKRQQEIEIAHRAKMVAKNFQEDKEYMHYISFLVRHWNELKPKEKMLITNISKWHDEHRNLSTNQRSVIAGLYAKYVL